MASIPIKLVEQPIRTALRTGDGMKGPYKATYSEETDSLRLYHYGTLIYEDGINGLHYLGGYSQSDRDAINTTLYIRMPGLKASNAQKKPSWAKREINGWWVG